MRRVAQRKPNEVVNLNGVDLEISPALGKFTIALNPNEVCLSLSVSLSLFASLSAAGLEFLGSYSDTGIRYISYEV